jgi:aryl-alcohol dehydrogenase-like predicted oxidoreductase
LLDRTLEWDLVPVCQNEGIGIIPWSPLRGGWLSGKYKRGTSGPVEGTRIESASKNNWSESWSAYNNERTWSVLDALHAVAGDVGKTPAQVALRWVIQKPGVTAPITGARTMAHLTDNLGATGWSLDDAHMQQLDQVSALELPYPQSFIANARGNR